MSSPLTLTTELDVVEIQNEQGTLGVASLSLTLTDTRPYLPSKSVRYTIDWGDGSEIYDSGKVASPASVSEVQHAYPPGDFVITITGYNYAVPQPAVVGETLDVSVRGNRLPVPLYEPALSGPLLPLAQDWFFNLGHDGQLLVSSARLLLAVAQGERLMNPGYGTTIREKLFAPLDGGTMQDIKLLLTQAFAEHEPRVQITSVDTVPDQENRRITVALTLVSLLDNRAIKLSATYAP